MNKRSMGSPDILNPEFVAFEGPLPKKRDPNTIAPGEENESHCTHPAWSQKQFPSMERIAEFQENCKQISYSLTRMEKALQDLLRLSERIASAEKNGELEDLCLELDLLIHEEEHVRGRVFSALDAVFRRINKRTFSLLDDPTSSSNEQPIPYENDVFVFVENSAIYVKTPHLANRNKHGIRHSTVDYCEFFAPAVERKMKIVEAQLPIFLEKNIDILVVYPKETAYIPDAENLDSKKVVDAITRPLIGGDSGECCSFSSKVIRTDRLAPGSYFSVTEGFAKVPSLQNSIEKLSRIFQEK